MPKLEDVSNLLTHSYFGRNRKKMIVTHLTPRTTQIYDLVQDWTLQLRQTVLSVVLAEAEETLERRLSWIIDSRRR
jgi:hypothetical protein